MNINTANQERIISNNLASLDISGANNKIIIQSHINHLSISGINNKIDGSSPNCLIDNLVIYGINNDIKLNGNCLNVNKTDSGINNIISFNGEPNNIGNNSSVRNNNNNNNNNSVSANNILVSQIGGNMDESNLSEFDKKKRHLFLEMDEYQYKHIQKYESRKETECAICLEEFKGIDIIKAFYKCEHIFHKNCLRNWLLKSNVCPLCKHDLKKDINQMH